MGILRGSIGIIRRVVLTQLVISWMETRCKVFSGVTYFWSSRNHHDDAIILVFCNISTFGRRSRWLFLLAIQIVEM